MKIGNNSKSGHLGKKQTILVLKICKWENN